MNCPIGHELLEAYVDGELSENIAHSFAEHLRECDICAEEEKFLRSIESAIRSLDMYTAPAGFTEAVLAEIEGQISSSDVSENLDIGDWLTVLGIKQLWQGTHISFREFGRSISFMKYLPRPKLRIKLKFSWIPVSVGIRW